MHTKIIIPIFKEYFSENEFFSINYSSKVLKDKDITFIFPNELNLEYYKKTFPKINFFSLPKEFFYSQKTYNQLCYERAFYEFFKNDCTHILILQPDAIVINSDILEWSNSRFDYIGGPESNNYSYNITSVMPFTDLPSFHPIRLQGCNGGLSLRKVESFIKVLEEYEELTKLFRTYAGGIGEDIFFSLMGRVSSFFQVPNELIASKFALTDKFQEWIAFNKALPCGFHAWYNTQESENYIKGLLPKIE